MYHRQQSSYAAVEPSQGCLLPSFCPNERACSTCDRDHTHLVDFAHACGYYSRAATISFTELQVRLLFEGGYYSRCGFYSNKYGNRNSWHLEPHVGSVSSYAHDGLRKGGFPYRLLTRGCTRICTCAFQCERADLLSFSSTSRLASTDGSGNFFIASPEYRIITSISDYMHCYSSRY